MSPRARLGKLNFSAPSLFEQSSHRGQWAHEDTHYVLDDTRWHFMPPSAAHDAYIVSRCTAAGPGWARPIGPRQGCEASHSSSSLRICSTSHSQDPPVSVQHRKLGSFIDFPLALLQGALGYLKRLISMQTLIIVGSLSSNSQVCVKVHLITFAQQKQL